MRHSGVLISRIAGLEPALPLDERRLLPGVLEMVARERLVGDRVDEVRGPHRQVGVHVDAGAQPAVVPVVGGPRLARDERDAELLAVGRAEQLHRTRPEPADEPVDDAEQAVRRGSRSRASHAASRSASGSGPGRSASSSAAAASNRASSRRTGSQAKQRRTWSRYGSGSPASARACVASATSWAPSQSRRSGSATSSVEPCPEGVGVVRERGGRPELTRRRPAPSDRPGRSSRRRARGCAGRAGAPSRR